MVYNRSKEIFQIFFLVFIVISISHYTYGSNRNEISGKITKIEELTTDELIQKLTEVSDFGVGFHPTAWASGFIAVEDEAESKGGIIGSPKPKVSPIMRELVRRGTESLPELINRLSDSRETKIKINHDSFFMAMWYSNEYEPRYGKSEPDINSIINNERYTKEYTIKVGDLCYVAIGQIVNRNLNAIRYQPSACLVINSPVESPILTESVKKDWLELTPEQHKGSLLEDLKCYWDTDRISGAAKRLEFYYNIKTNIPSGNKPNPKNTFLISILLIFASSLSLFFMFLFYKKLKCKITAESNTLNMNKK
jgi:hypothetical protein